MFFLIVRLLAVYLGTAAVSLYLAHRLVSRLRFRVAILLAFGPFLLVGKALLTGGIYAPIDITYQGPPLSLQAVRMGTQTTKTPLLGDVVHQEIPWRKAVREAMKNGRLPLWNRFILAGEPLLAVQQPVVLHPATWIGFLLPLAQAWTFEMALRYLLALLSAFLFLRELGCREVAALLGAFAWAFCDYLVFFAGYPLSPAAAPFPLLLLGLRRLVTRTDRGAAALTVVALLLIVTSGHPESLLHCVAGAGIYFLFELFFAGRGKRLRPILLSLLVGALTLGLSAVLLLPLAETLPHTREQFYRSTFYAHAVKSLPLFESLRHTAANVVPYTFGVSGYGDGVPGFEEPSSYAGSVLWPLVVLGLLSKRRERWPLVALGILGIAVTARVPLVTDAISTLPLFDIGINQRMIFLAAFALAGLAAFGVEALREDRNDRIFAAGAAVSLLLMGILAVQAQRRLPGLRMPPGYFRDRVLLQAVPLVLASAAVLGWRRAGRRSLVGASLLLLLIAQRGLEEKDFYPTYPSKAFYPPVPALEKIPRREPYRMAAIGFTFAPNISALYEVEDVRGYEAMTFRPLTETFSLWCVPMPISFNRVDNPTRPFLSFLNVRYFLAGHGSWIPPGWPVLYRGEEGFLLENPRVLPRAFVPKTVAYEADGPQRVALLSTIEDFANQGVLADPPGPGQGGWLANGTASLRISSYEAQRMTLEIDAREPALVATSVTAWPGWKLTVDGSRTPLVSYNHAFLAFRVGGGRHTAVLNYFPDGFAAGLVLSAGTLILSMLLLLRARAPRPSTP